MSAARQVVGATVWLTGLSGSGKSTIASALGDLLRDAGIAHMLLDGDDLRRGLNADLGFGEKDRAENVRRVGEVARLVAKGGLVAIVSLISPYRADRERVRAAHEVEGTTFVEVFVDTPLAVCIERDPKRLYRRAIAGELLEFTGVDAPYEAPLNPDVVLSPGDGSPGDQAERVFSHLRLA